MTEREKGPVILAGFNGIGKSFTIEHIAERYHAQMLLSVMTREPRLYEIEGVHGFFRSEFEHDQMANRGEFATTFEVMGNKYSIPKAEIRRIRAAGDVPMAAMEAHTVVALKTSCPETVGVFMEPVTHKIAVNRMYDRGDKDEDVDRRIFRSLLEIDQYYCNKAVRANFQLHLWVDGTEENFLSNVAQIVDFNQLVLR